LSDIEDVKEQLMDLQSQLAFQEDTVATLNEAMIEQQQEILTLRRQLTLLKERQDEQARQVDREEGGAIVDEKPPHY
jgi:SlyX protein